MPLKKHFLFCSFILILVLGCDKRRDKKSYRTYEEISSLEKSKEVLSTQIASLKNEASGSNQGISWSIPVNWVEKQATGFRIGSFKSQQKLDVSVITFPGDAGGVLQNVKRWLGQIGFNLSTKELKLFLDTVVTKKNKQGLSYYFVNSLSLGKKQHFLGAIFFVKTKTIFVKITGNKTLIEKDKKDFLMFCDSITHQEK